MLNQLRASFGPLLCAAIPLRIWYRLIDVSLLLPHWHIVSDSMLEHISGLYQYRTLRQFRKDLDFFLRNYKPVSLDQILNHLDDKERLPKRCFMPSFDDGFRQIHETVAPILLQKGIPATFLLTTSTIDNTELCYPQKKSLILHRLSNSGNPSAMNSISDLLSMVDIRGQDTISKIRNIYYRNRHFLDRIADILKIDFSTYLASVKPYLTTNQIRDLMQRGFEIGAHTVDHPQFSELEVDEQLSQAKESAAVLSQKLDYTCRSFAFPYTDSGISEGFFDRIFKISSIRVTFGIGGIQKGPYPRNLPRFSMERTNRPARQILARQFGRAFF